VSLKRLFDLQGRTALITGGSRGLGLQMAEALGEMGARVALTARKREELDQAVAHLASQGVEAVAIPCDMGNASAIPSMVESAIAALGPLDILVNNAGTTWGAATVEHPLEAWEKVIGLNLTAMFVTSREVGKRCMLPRRSGRIINVASSVAGLSGTHPDFMRTIAYNASKGGVVNFTRSLAAEWAPDNINVNAIAPGFFPTKMTKGLREMLGDDALAARAPMNRLGGPEDLKGITVLLASDAGAFITGQIVAVDGGVTAI